MMGMTRQRRYTSSSQALSASAMMHASFDKIEASRPLMMERSVSAIKVLISPTAAHTKEHERRKSSLNQRRGRYCRQGHAFVDFDRKQKPRSQTKRRS